MTDQDLIRFVEQKLDSALGRANSLCASPERIGIDSSVQYLELIRARDEIVGCLEAFYGRLESLQEYRRAALPLSLVYVP